MSGYAGHPSSASISCACSTRQLGRRLCGHPCCSICTSPAVVAGVIPPSWQTQWWLLGTTIPARQDARQAPACLAVQQSTCTRNDKPCSFCAHAACRPREHLELSSNTSWCPLMAWHWDLGHHLSLVHLRGMTQLQRRTARCFKRLAPRMLGVPPAVCCFLIDSAIWVCCDP